MIEELKRQLAEIDRDLKPVLAHVEAAQARRAGLLSAIASAEAVAAVVPEPKPPEPEDAAKVVDSAPVEESTPLGKRKR